MSFQKLRFISLICLLNWACVRIQYVDEAVNCLPNHPTWQLFFGHPILKDISLRVDSINYVGTVKDTIIGVSFNSNRYDLSVKMNIETGRPFRYNANRKPHYQPTDIEIRLLVSDSLDDSTIAKLKECNTNNKVEKGFVGQNRFLYINDYELKHRVFAFVNLSNRRAYTLQETSSSFYGSIDYFLMDGCRQGIQFLDGGEIFSLGDYLMR